MSYNRDLFGSRYGLEDYLNRKQAAQFELPLNFMAKHDEIFRHSCWFVEHRPTQRWVKGESGILTSEPTFAMQFKTEPAALAYIIQNHLGEEYEPTEHEFV